MSYYVEETRPQGYITIVEQSDGIDYLRMAYALALSLKATQTEVPWLTVLVTPGMEIPERYRLAFDQVVEMKGKNISGDAKWKIHNKWMAFSHTPYRETVLLDADMLFCSDVSWWWPFMAKRQAWVCTDVQTYRGEPITSTYYRKTFEANHLPNAYTAFAYFQQTDLANQLFMGVFSVVDNWDLLIQEVLPKETPDRVSGDVAFALSMELQGITDQCVRPGLGIPTFVHMKSKLQKWTVPVSESWTRHIATFLRPDCGLYIGNHRQTVPVHYHDKAFLTDDVIAILEKANA